MEQDFSSYIHDKQARIISHTPFYPIDNMNDQELRKSLLEELLTINMIEKHNNTTLDFGYNQLFKFVLPSHKDRIKAALQHEDICGLVDISEVNHKIQLRIKNHHEILLAAMDYCGVYFEGYRIPEGITVYGLSSEVKGMLENNPVDNVAEYFAKLLHGQLNEDK